MRKDTIPEYSITVMMNVKNAVIVTHFLFIIDSRNKYVSANEKYK